MATTPIVDLFNDLTPANLNNNWGAITLGVRFTSSISCSILGVEYYKSTSDTLPHTGSLWTEAGTLLARVATAETQSASGWNSMSFASPYVISASSVYVISFHTRWGGSYTTMLASGYTPTNQAFKPRSMLVIPSPSAGRYTYSATDAFPTTVANEWYGMDATIRLDGYDVGYSASAGPSGKGEASVVGYLRSICLGGPTNNDSDSNMGRHLQVGLKQNMIEGYPAPPSVELEIPGFYRFKWAVQAGRRTVSVKVKQDLAQSSSILPSLVVKNNPKIGIPVDVIEYAPTGTGWKTIGPVQFTPRGNGVVWVELRNNDIHHFNSSAYFDNIVTT